MGLRVGSGVVESACKSVVGGRLERGGMRWTAGAANAILALRYAVLDERHEDFWNQRARPRMAA